MTLRIRRLKQIIIKVITSRTAILPLLLLSLISALFFAGILGNALSGRTSLVVGIAEVEIGQTRLPLCAFSGPLNSIKWEQVTRIISNLTAQANQHQDIVIKTEKTQGNKSHIVLSFNKSRTVILLCPPTLLSQTDDSDTTYFNTIKSAQNVYVKMTKILHVYIAPLSDQLALTEIIILGIDDNGDKVSLHITFMVTPRLVLESITFTLLTYGITTSLLYVALALDKHDEPHYSHDTTGIIINNYRLLLIPIYVVLTVLHAGIALSLALNDTVFYTSMELAAIVASFGMLFIFSMAYAASAIMEFIKSEFNFTKRVAVFAVKVILLLAYSLVVYFYMYIVQIFLSFYQLWLHMLNIYLLNPIKVILSLMVPFLAVGLEVLIHRRRDAITTVRPELVLMLFYIVATVDLLIPMMRSVFPMVGYAWFVSWGSLEILVFFALCAGALLVSSPCDAAHKESELSISSLLIFISLLALMAISIATFKIKVTNNGLMIIANTANVETTHVVGTLVGIMYFYLYPYWFATVLYQNLNIRRRPNVNGLST